MRRPPLVSLLVALALTSAQCLAAAERSREARWLADYLRIDSTNPPGREDRAAAYLADILRQEGIGADRYVTPAGRVSLVARLPATVPNAPWIALVHHLDVVPAGDGWSAPPFGGEIIEGDLYGRGAIDTKSLGIAHLAAVVEAARLPERRRGLLLLAVADEENGGGEGMSWLLERHPEILDGVEAALGEGGLNRTVLRRTFFWGIEVAQKRAYWLEASSRGRPGHGSSLNPESATHELVRGLARLVDRPPNWKLQAPVRDFFRAYGGLDSSLRGPAFDADHAVGADGPAKWVPPGWWSLLLDTVQVTGLAAGERPNVAPAEARARLDVRLLPETDADEYLADLAAVLGPAVNLSILLKTPPSPPSPTGTALWRELSATLAVEAPVVPVMIAGITDSRFLRQRSVPAYGFSPFELEGIEMLRVHGPDERIALDRFDAGVARMRRVVRALVSTEP